MRTGFAISAAIALLASSVSVQAEPVTACTANRFCYCIGWSPRRYRSKYRKNPREDRATEDTRKRDRLPQRPSFDDWWKLHGP